MKDLDKIIHTLNQPVLRLPKKCYQKYLFLPRIRLFLLLLMSFVVGFGSCYIVFYF